MPFPAFAEKMCLVGAIRKKQTKKKTSFSEVLWFLWCLYIICIFLIIKVGALSLWFV